MAPKHEHDCETCRFLGTLGGVDHYVHESKDCPAELIQRRSSEEPDYSAWPLDEIDLLPLEAQRRWALTLALYRAA